MNWNGVSQLLWGVSQACFAAYDHLREEPRQQARGYANVPSDVDALTRRATMHTVFRDWVGQLASWFNADVEWDEDGDAALRIALDGEAYIAVVCLKDGIVHVNMPSNVRFRSGRFPPEVAAMLAERNRKLSFGDWDLMDRGRQAFFFLKAKGRMEQVDIGALKAVIVNMLTEVAALDRTLCAQGYVA